MDTENGNQDLRCNILDRKKKIKKNSYKFRMHEKDNDKNFSNCKSSYTKTKPVVAFSHKPACFLQNKQQMFAAFLPDIKEFIHEYLSEMIQKKYELILVLLLLCLFSHLFRVGHFDPQPST